MLFISGAALGIIIGLLIQIFKYKKIKINLNKVNKPYIIICIFFLQTIMQVLVIFIPLNMMIPQIVFLLLFSYFCWINRSYWGVLHLL